MNCSNKECRKLLSDEAVILIVGAVASRYCSVDCIEANYDRLLHLARAASYRSDEGPARFSQRVERLMGWRYKQ